MRTRTRTPVPGHVVVYDPCPGSNKPAVNGHCSVCWSLYECYDSIGQRTYKLGSRKNTLKPHRLIQTSKQYYREPVNDNLCPNCEKREPTIEFLPDSGGVMEWAHGGSQLWCEPCVVETQLKHARECTKTVPKLEQKLAKLLQKEKTNAP